MSFALLKETIQTKNNRQQIEKVTKHTWHRTLTASCVLVMNYSPMCRAYHNPQNHPSCSDLKGICHPFHVQHKSTDGTLARTAVKIFRITSNLSTPPSLSSIPTPKPTCSCSTFSFIH